ncbi:MAG: BamA/TamA family outer membrane protein [Candidatus Latescibacteria bacterium]|nr:BamA/TamA family outer membrane protein [Candidatus Latescibacterota bacterium]
MMTSRCVAAALAALFVLAAAPADAYYFGRNKVQTANVARRVLVTPHFEITHAADAEELAVRAAIVAERTYAEYAARFGHELERRIPFILYSSHTDFAQTNVADDLLGEGTGGFTEPVRNRMVLPYEESHADFVHVLRHELVHVFMFDMVFGSSRSTASRSPFFRIPLWFAEGLAEWYSSGWDPGAEMYLRDAATSGYLWPLDRVGGFLVYKEGQAALRMISERYGEEKIPEMCRLLNRSRGMDRVLDAALGLDIEALDRLFARYVRGLAWPSYGSFEEPEDIARRLTDHREDEDGANFRPALSPDGTQIAYFSDRDGLMSLYLMSAIDGQVLRRLARGQRASRFESLHPYRSRPAFSPDGREVAFVARSGNAETLHTVEVATGASTRDVRLDLDGASSPAWSPDGRWIALVGTVAGRTDLYLLDLAPDAGDVPAAASARAPAAGGTALLRMTDDAGDESGPAWSPDGSRLAFAHNPVAEVRYQFTVGADGERRLDWARFDDGDAAVQPGHRQTSRLVLLDVFADRRVELAAPAGSWREPAWITDSELCVVADGDGAENLARLQLDAAGETAAEVRRLTNVPGAAAHPSYASGADRLAFAAFREGGWDLYAVDGWAAWSLREPAGTPAGDVAVATPAPPDYELSSEVSDVANIGVIKDYRPRFSIDMSDALGGGAVSFSPQAGLGMANVINLSDLLGDHRLSFLVNVYGSLSDSDLAASYAYLKRRVDVGVGLFHFKNYYNTAVTSVGELLPDDTFFSERNYGLYASASYPFSTFRRLSLELQAFASQRTVYSLDPSGTLLIADGTRTDTLLQPTLTFVHDSAYYGWYGPVTGSRLLLQFTPSLAVGGGSLDRRTALLDLRRYWLPARGNTLALRVLAAASTGDDPRAFVLGGPFTLRGYDFYDYRTTSHLAGPKIAMANLEYRLPLLDAVYFGWPARWGFGPVGATLFLDLGAAWDDVFSPFGDDAAGRWGLRDLRGSYGIGLRTRLGFLPLKFDWGRRTDLRSTGGTEFQFSIGPEF